MAHDPRRPNRRQTGPATARSVFAIAFINIAAGIVADWTGDRRAWPVVLIIVLVSAVCVTALIIAHHRRR